MKWDLKWKLPFGPSVQWKLDTRDQKKLKEFKKDALPNQKRRHLDSLFQVEDEEYDSSFSIHIER